MSSNILKDEAYTYVGTEMRKYRRRVKVDQREMLRYEPSKDNRRIGAERRRGGSAAWDQLGVRG